MRNIYQCTCAGDAAASKQPGSETATMASLDNNTLADLKSKLDTELDIIIKRFSGYIDCIEEALRAKSITVEDLTFKLQKISAHNNPEKKRTLLSTHKEKLNKASSIKDVLMLIYEEYANFLNYEVFQFIVDKYELNDGRQEFQYPCHLKAYIEKHKISEFVQTNPLLKDFYDDSKEVIVKMDIKSTTRLSMLDNIKTAIAKILDLNSAALRILDIEEGCVVVTFLIPTPIAEEIFNKDTILTKLQKQELQALSVIWLQCNRYRFQFRAEDPKAERDIPSR